ncbi:hypothetical protein SNTW_11670 [Helicobacter suis]|uniref:Uncharacterized protein n=1 Tax=Helicobacter suis TaxID=104628 RepID=A0A6J4D0H2_9HELI|nr:hypothetical protein SNTW_11670 [Helicobacter suis]
MRKLILPLLLDCIHAQPGFFKDFKATNLAQKLNLASKLTENPHPCAHLKLGLTTQQLELGSQINALKNLKNQPRFLMI